MKNTAYWEARSEELLTDSFKKAETVEKYLTGLYRNSLLKVSKDYNDLIKPFIVNGEIDIEKLNQAKLYDKKFAERFRRLESQLSIFTNNISEQEQRKILSLLEKTYEDNFIKTFKDFTGKVPGVEVLNKTAINAAVKTPWTKDGKEFSDRIWANRDKLNANLRRLLSNAIANGESPKKTLQKLNEIMGAGASNCQRIIRTETNAIYSKAAKDSYAAVGVERVEILAALDSRTSEICHEKNGEIVALAGAQVGRDLPPFHPNCRSTFCAYIED